MTPYYAEDACVAMVTDRGEWVTLPGLQRGADGQWGEIYHVGTW